MNGGKTIPLTHIFFNSKFRIYDADYTEIWHGWWWAKICAKRTWWYRRKTNQGSGTSAFRVTFSGASSVYLITLQQEEVCWSLTRRYNASHGSKSHGNSTSSLLWMETLIQYLLIVLSWNSPTAVCSKQVTSNFLILILLVYYICPITVLMTF